MLATFGIKPEAEGRTACCESKLKPLTHHLKYDGFVLGIVPDSCVTWRWGQRFGLTAEIQYFLRGFTVELRMNIAQ